MSAPDSYRRITHQVSGDTSPPDYERIVVALSDAELEEEILEQRGEPEYQAALVAEHDRRARKGPPTSEGGR